MTSGASPIEGGDDYINGNCASVSGGKVSFTIPEDRVPAPQLSIIIPAFNEADALPLALNRIGETFNDDRYVGTSFEVLVMSDGSTDSTFDVATSAMGAGIRGRVVEFATNVGSHAAIRSGLALAKGDSIAIISADGQDPPEVIPQLLSMLSPTIDIAWGRRVNREGDSRLTSALASLYYRLFRLLTRLNYPDSGLDFLVMTRRVRDALVTFPERNLPLFLTIFNLGFGQTYVDYERAQRTAGASGWTTRKKFKVAGDMLVSVSAAPLRLLSVVGAIVGLAGLAFGIITILRALLGETPDQTGWASLMTAISVMGGLILIGISILGEYVWRTLDEVRGRPIYVISRDSGPIDE